MHSDQERGFWGCFALFALGTLMLFVPLVVVLVLR